MGSFCREASKDLAAEPWKPALTLAGRWSSLRDLVDCGDGVADGLAGGEVERDGGPRETDPGG